MVSNSVSKLQIYIQQANFSIETSTSSIISSMPAMARESKLTLERARDLKERMNSLEKEICKSETVCSSNLERLDDMKVKLESARSFLEQSDSFSKLSIELEEFLESEKKDVTQACEKLAALQMSYELQLGLAGQAERELVLEEFKNRFEAVVAEQVVKALNENNVEQSCRFVEMFTKIDRLSQIVSYHSTLQREVYNTKWNEIVENQENHRFLADFYDFLLNSWGKSLKWYRDVFKSEGKVETMQIFTDLLNNLNPSRESVLSSRLKSTPDKMEFLAEISDSNEKFQEDLCEKIEGKLPEKLISAVFDFFNIFIVQYSSIEQSFLTSQLEEFKILQSNSADTMRYLEASTAKVFELANQALSRQTKITQNCAIVSLIYILNMFFKSFLEKVKKVQLQLDASRGDHQDWNLLQLSINFLTTIGNFKIKIDEIEGEVKKVMLSKIKEAGGGYKIVGVRDINEFEKISSRLIVNEFPVIFESLATPIEAISRETHQTVLRIIFSPIENFFKKLDVAENSDASVDLPDYSFTPNEYITEIGQFLLTLPQNLEPLLLDPTKPLALALEIGDSSYRDSNPPADVLLSLIAFETCVLYEEKVKEIQTISDSGAKQLAIDVEYLGSVLEELGLTISTNLKCIAQLFKIKKENYFIESAGTDAKLVATVRQMRNIQTSM